jgi:E3 ubiquitin-protein ligase UBR1
MHVIRLCYLAELVKVVIKMGRNQDTSDWDNAYASQYHDAFVQFCLALRQADRGQLDDEDGYLSTAFAQPCFSAPGSSREFARKYALVFLRKVALLLQVRHGVVFQNHISSNPDADELDRLTEALRLPTFDEMCASALPSPYNPPTVPQLVNSWVMNAYPAGMGKSSGMTIGHPGIFELIGLPKNYDTLMEETMKRRCPTTGKDVTDPMLCLFCGEIFCGQSICCLKRAPGSGSQPSIGGAQQHMMK